MKSLRYKTKRVLRWEKNWKRIVFLWGAVIGVCASAAIQNYWTAVGGEVENALFNFDHAHHRIPLVYSAPVKFVSGMKVSSDFIETELLRRGYHQSANIPNMPGTFARTASTVEVLSKFQPRRVVTVRFDANRQTRREQIAEITGNDEKILFLEPQLLGEGIDEQGSSVFYRPLEAFSIPFIQAILATEDPHFYRHQGVDFTGRIRAALESVSTQEDIENRATLTQKVVDHLIPLRERNFSGEMKNVVAALYLEHLLTKEEILERYLNQVSIQSRQNGTKNTIGAASRELFKKQAYQLSLSESALLAGLRGAPPHVDSPESLNEKIKARNRILQRMYDQGYVDEASFARAAIEPLPTEVKEHDPQDSAYFLSQVKRNLAAKQTDTGSTFITTSLNPLYQSCGIKAAHDGFAEIKESDQKNQFGDIQIGIISMTTENGEITAWVGGAPHSKPIGFDRILHAHYRGPFSADHDPRSTNSYMPIAAVTKHGPSEGNHDVWFVGTTSNVATGVWIHSLSGGKTDFPSDVTAPVWKRYVDCISPYLNINQSIQDKGVVTKYQNFSEGIFG